MKKTTGVFVLVILQLLSGGVAAQTPQETFEAVEELSFDTSYPSQRGCVVTYNDAIYLAFVDANLRTRIVKKTPDGQVADTVIFPQTSSDGHNGPSVGIDRDGYIHVAGNMHQNPWHYKVSDNPEDISSFTEIAADSPRMIPGESITYPLFARDNAGTLFVSFRHRVYMDSWIVGCLAAGIARYDPDSRTWTMLGGDDYLHQKTTFFWINAGVDSNSSAYKDSTAGGCSSGSYQPSAPHIRFSPDNRMHLAWVADDGAYDLYCSASGHHTHVFYAYSDDGGDTFHRADGAVHSSMPIGLDDGDVVSGPVFGKTIGGYSYRAYVEVMPDGQPVVQLRTENSDENYLSFWDPGSGWSEPLRYPSGYRGEFIVDSHGIITGVGFDGGTGMARSFDRGQTWRTYSGIEAIGHSARFDYEFMRQTNHLRFHNRFSGTAVTKVWTVRFSGTELPDNKTCAELNGECCTSGQECAGGAFVYSPDCGTLCCAQGGSCQDPPTVFSPIPYFGDRDNYTELNPSRWSVEEDGGDLRYFLRTSDYDALPGSRMGEYALVNDRTYSDFTMSVSAKSAEDFDTNAKADICLVFGWQNDNNYLYLMLNSDESENMLFRVVDGVREELGSAAGTSIEADTYHQIELTREGNQVAVRLDGTERMVVDDPMPVGGAVGIGSFNDSVYFDDIEVTVQDCTQELCNGWDDDCDGETDEDFDLDSDPANCGFCGNACDAGEECRNGECHDPGGDGNTVGGGCGCSVSSTNRHGRLRRPGSSQGGTGTSGLAVLPLILLVFRMRRPG